MSNDTTPPSDQRHPKIVDALKRVERAVFTRPVPKSARAQMKFLCTRAKGSPTDKPSAWAPPAVLWRATRRRR